MTHDEQALRQYYDRRAQEYEEIYHRTDPVRQGEQVVIAAAMRQTLLGRRVLEVACGTGFWTQVAAEVARHIVATDTSPDMLAIARAKAWPPGRVVFREGDAYRLDSVLGTFDAGLANFWFSHIPKAGLDEFLRSFHERLGAGAAVFMADNVYVPGIGGELVSRPGVEDTFKIRALGDGSHHEVLKNYYDGDSLRRILTPRARNLDIHIGTCFWWLSYQVI